MSKERSGGGIGIFGLLGVVFITLKLCKVIDWHWAWVLAPIWAPIALALLLFAIAGIISYFNDK